MKPQQTRNNLVRINRAITCWQVRVTDADGHQLGVMPTRDAIQMAFDAGLDLVEIAPTATPPVCRICDYGKLKYDESRAKKAQTKNSKQVDMKEVQVSPVIGTHDLETKIGSIKKFLLEGRLVQVTCVFSKRQIMFKDQGFKVMEQITEAVKEVGVPEKAPTFNEKRLQSRYRPGVTASVKATA